MRAHHDPVHRLTRFAERVERNLERISWVRFATVITGVVTALALWDAGLSPGIPPVVLVTLAVFVWLVILTRRAERHRSRIQLLAGIRARGRARRDIDWERLPYTPPGSTPDQHAYAYDLNLFGERSLLHLIDCCCSAAGRQRLTVWLSRPLADPDAIALRQNRVREIRDDRRFRERLELAGREAGGVDRGLVALEHWLTDQTANHYGRVLGILGPMAAVNILLGGAWLFGVIGPWVLASVTVYGFVYIRARRRMSDAFEEAFYIESGLRHVLPVLSFLERPRHVSEPLEPLLREFRVAQPSELVERVTRIAHLAGSGKSPFAGFILNALVPWDLYFAERLERVKPGLAEFLPRWLDGWHELEALASLAEFAAARAGVMPRCDPEGPVIHAVGLEHPLLPHSDAVPNPVELDAPGDLLLITGSNMSGKTTFLRTVGLNVVLAQAGSAVPAREFRWRPVRVFTSIQIEDSLVDGISYFYAEVQRYRWMLDELGRAGQPLLFLIDEIFRGTNNRERLIGSTALVRYVTGRNGCGIISTHDLELVKLAEDERVRNFHFADDVKDGAMVFDYRLRPGACPVTNALEIMRREGLPVEPPPGR